MAVTTNNAFPLIAPSDTADVPRDHNALANAVDTVIGDMSTVPTTAKDAAGAITELHAAIEDIDVDLPDNSVTDTKIGNRTIDDTVVAATGADTPTRLWSKLANMIKRITGKANWYTPPVTSIEALHTDKLNATSYTAADVLAKIKTVDGAGSGLETELIAWQAYANHTIFDASKGLSPTGGAVNPDNAANPWSTTYPTLMGWNGSSTYGLRVDSARTADNVGGAVVRESAGQLELFTGGVWKPVGGSERYKNVVSSTIAGTGALIPVLSITGKKGFLSTAFLSYGTSTPTGMGLRITLDGAVIYSITTTGSSGSSNYYGGLIQQSSGYYKSGNTNDASGQFRFPFTESVSSPLPSALPGMLFFKNSLLIEFRQGTLSLSYATE